MYSSYKAKAQMWFGKTANSGETTKLPQPSESHGGGGCNKQERVAKSYRGQTMNEQEKMSSKHLDSQSVVCFIFNRGRMFPVQTVINIWGIPRLKSSKTLKLQSAFS